MLYGERGKNKVLRVGRLGFGDRIKERKKWEIQKDNKPFKGNCFSDMGKDKDLLKGYGMKGREAEGMGIEEYFEGVVSRFEEASALKCGWQRREDTTLAV